MFRGAHPEDPPSCPGDARFSVIPGVGSYRRPSIFVYAESAFCCARAQTQSPSAQSPQGHPTKFRRDASPPGGATRAKRPRRRSSSGSPESGGDARGSSHPSAATGSGCGNEAFCRPSADSGSSNASGSGSPRWMDRSRAGRASPREKVVCSSPHRPCAHRATIGRGHYRAQALGRSGCRGRHGDGAR